MSAPVGVILAGGRATRMGGGDKGALMLGEQTLLARVLARLSPQVAAIVLNANGDAARFSDYGLPVAPDSLAGFPGPLAGVLAGMDWAADHGASHILTAAADTPFFPHDLGAQLALAGGAQGFALAATRDPESGKLYRHPTFGLWPVALRDDLRRALEDGLRKVVLWTDSHDAGLAEFPVGAYDPFFNVNTPDDLSAAEALL